MISSFWNFCSACPSVPVGKLHSSSEYRSTFQWHEIVGSQSAETTIVRQPSHSHPDHLSQLAQGRADEPPIVPRRKKNPELANRSSNGWLTQSATYDQADSSSTKTTKGTGGSGGPRKSLSMGTIRSSGTGTVNIVPIHSQKLSLMPQYNKSTADDVGDTMTTSAPTVTNTTTTAAAGNMSTSDQQYSSGEVRIHIARETDASTAQETQHQQQTRNAEEFKKKEYKSEYKKRFRPFSQYEYVDGRFFKKKGDQEIGGSPWYGEVIELRKKAGEYKFRGWGTELGPQNIAEYYHGHIWDQVSKRSSLAALALITTTPKSISKEEKDKENARKYPGRPHTATPRHPISDLQRKSEAVHSKKKEDNRIQNKSTSRVKELKSSTTKNSPKPPSAIQNKRLIREGARSQSCGPRSGSSPRKTTRQQSAASSVSEKDNTTAPGGWKIHLDSSQVETNKRHPRPTTLSTSPSIKASSGRDSKSTRIKTDKNSADPYLGYTEQIVKSPPEPTRVKSPEQQFSPDPVNWTVPLDTSKSFTVTQNIREAAPQSPLRLRRQGEKLHGIHHPTSTHHSSASSPISSFSTRSAPTVPSSISGSQPGSNAAVPSPLKSVISTVSSKVPDKPVSTAVLSSSSSLSTSNSKERNATTGGGGTTTGRPTSAAVSGAGPGTTIKDSSVPSLPKTNQIPPSKLEQKASLLSQKQQPVTTTSNTSNTTTATPRSTAVNGFDDNKNVAASKPQPKERVATNTTTSTRPSSQPRMGAAMRIRPDSAKPSTTPSTTTSTPSTKGTTTTSASSKSTTSTTKPSSNSSNSSSTVSSVTNSPAIKTVTSSGSGTVGTFSPKTTASNSTSFRIAPKTATTSNSSTISSSVTHPSSAKTTTTTTAHAPIRPATTTSSSSSSTGTKITPSSINTTTNKSSVPTPQAPSTFSSKSQNINNTSSSISYSPRAAPNNNNISNSNSSAAPTNTSTSIPTNTSSSIPIASDKSKGKPTNSTTTTSGNSSSISSAFKCLDDPQFMFDPPKTTSPAKSVMNKSQIDSQKTKGIPTTFTPTTTTTTSTSVPSVTSGLSSTTTTLPESHKSTIPTMIPSSFSSSGMKPPMEPTRAVPSTTAFPSSKLPESVKANTTVGPSSSPYTTSSVSSISGNISPFMPSSTTSIPQSMTTSTFIPSNSGIKGSANQGKSSSAFRVLEAPTSPPQSIFTTPTPTTTSSSSFGSSTSGILSASSSTNIDPTLKKKADLPSTTSFIPPAPVSAPKRGIGGISSSEIPPPTKSSAYRVLEAPDDDEPMVSVISPSSGRSVLEKARTRFDKFWGKDKDKSKDEEK